MSLNDKDILELNELCSAVVDGTLNDKQRARLGHWLSTSDDARRFYVRATGLSASLYYYASEMQSEKPDAPAHRRTSRHIGWTLGLLAAAAASIVAVVWIARPRHEVTPTLTQSTTKAEDTEFVARLTGSKDCEWAGNTPAVQLGGRLEKGQRVELAKGFAEITFDCGAQLILQGPVSLDVDSAWAATLNRGTLKASLPAEAMGFSISNSRVQVVDLGTEFTMFTDTAGAATEVTVLKGEIEAAPKTSAGEQQPFVLREKESRRFATSGVSVVNDAEANSDWTTRDLPLDRYLPPAAYAHWSFDEPAGATFRVDSSDLSIPPTAATLEKASGDPTQIASAHSPGRYHGALRFDGRLYAKAAFPGISENTPHSLAFWVNVPKDANLSSSYAMLAWGVNRHNLSAHPIHVGWNRSPNEGIIGVLRTDYGGGYALGATPLRDGRWHHVTVVFIPRNDPESPMEVKQYVDGRLEGEGRPSPAGSDIFKYATENTQDTINGTVWLGCRLGVRGVRADRFSGQIDELFIADRALEPQEIIRLMNDNQL